jgi:flagellar biosynthetic protein FlhB
MADEDDSQKTEEPTQKKLDETRKKGQVPMSREMNNWIMLLAGTIIISGYGGYFVQELGIILKNIVEISAFTNISEKEGAFSELMIMITMDIFWLIAPIFLFLSIAAFLAPFIQIGPLFAPESIKPKLDKISPIQGFTRIFSMRSLMEFVKGLIKIALITGVASIILYPYMSGIDHFMQLEVLDILKEILAIFIRMMVGILAVFFVVAALDVFYQRYEHMKKMRMSKQEIKDEYKQAEGDPHVKGRLKQLRMQKAQQRMMSNVPEADVVITNPTHYAVALKYKPESMDAPVMVAKGVDEVAMRIREVAKEHDITIYEAPPLARALFDTMDIDDMIPEEHFKAVAKVISYVFKLKGKMN